MTTCLIELPDEIFTQVRQVAVAEQKTINQLIAEWLIQRVTILRPPVPQADPEILKFFGSLPDFPDRGTQGEYEQRERLE